jgi:hypothetical protein
VQVLHVENYTIIFNYNQENEINAKRTACIVERLTTKNVNSSPSDSTFKAILIRMLTGFFLDKLDHF